MSATDATRLLDVAMRIERMATAVVGAEDLPDPYGEPARENGLEQRLVDAGLDVGCRRSRGSSTKISGRW